MERTMQYMLLVIGDESRLNLEPGTAVSPEIQAYVAALRKAGVMVGGERLQPTRTAKRISIRDGKTRVMHYVFGIVVVAIGIPLYFYFRHRYKATKEIIAAAQHSDEPQKHA